jgi:hypothetical protein
MSSDDGHDLRQRHRFFKESENMVANSMKAFTSTPNGATFADDFWGDNAMRFLGIRGEDGKIRTEETSTGGRLLAACHKALAPVPNWLSDSPAPAGGPHG